MGKRMGSLLEKNVQKLFTLNGFEAERNVILNGYEIDVLAKLGKIKIICQCKQYERSRLNTKDTIHLWSSKNGQLNADKVIVAIYGQEVTTEERNLAESLGILLWDESDLDELDNLPKEEFIESLGLGDNKKLKMESNGWFIVDIILVLLGLAFLQYGFGLIFLIIFAWRLSKNWNKYKLKTQQVRR